MVRYLEGRSIIRMTDEAHNPPKSLFQQCLDRWNVTRAEYDTTPHSEHFFVVQVLICKSDSPTIPDSSITIFRRGDKWGFALAVWNSMTQGTMWLPTVQCEIFASQEQARAEAIMLFERMATSKRLLAWLDSLSDPSIPQQMSLF